MIHQHPGLSVKAFVVLKAFVAGSAMALVTVTASPASPASAADPDELHDIVLQNSSGVAYASGDYPVSAVGSGSISITFLGTTYSCTSASGVAVLHSSQTSVPAPYLEFTGSSILGCAGPLGTTMNITQVAGCYPWITGTLGQYVHLGPVDLNFIGMLNAGYSAAPCFRATSTSGPSCGFDIYGQTAADFDETTQRLTLSGSGLTITNASGLCTFANGAAANLDLDLAIAAGENTGDEINARP